MYYYYLKFLIYEILIFNISWWERENRLPYYYLQVKFKSKRHHSTCGTPDTCTLMAWYWRTTLMASSRNQTCSLNLLPPSTSSSHELLPPSSLRTFISHVIHTFVVGWTNLKEDTWFLHSWFGMNYTLISHLFYPL